VGANEQHDDDREHERDRGAEAEQEAEPEHGGINMSEREGEVRRQ
jgi:hypothetical protein